MSVMGIVVPLALILAAGAVALYIWAVRDGQYEDLETPALRVLLDDEPERPSAPRGQR